jgi:hypothetical protein
VPRFAHSSSILRVRPATSNVPCAQSIIAAVPLGVPGGRGAPSDVVCREREDGLFTVEVVYSRSSWQWMLLFRIFEQSKVKGMMEIVGR